MEDLSWMSKACNPSKGAHSVCYRPWLVDGWVTATDGKVQVAVSSEGHDVQAVNPISDSHAEAARSVLALVGAPLASTSAEAMKEWCDVQAVDVDCEECNGTGTLNCYACDGDVDCESCDSRGQVKMTPTLGRFHGHGIDRDGLADLFVHLSGPCQASSARFPDGPDVLVFAGNGWKVTVVCKVNPEGPEFPAK